jgi:Secretion system C-terminal sorting domain/FG-GAP-like repeat
LQKLYSQQTTANYEKALARLEKSIRSGQFARYTQQKRQQIWNRICRYARQLGIKIKASVAAACLAAGLSFATPASAQQTFTKQTGANNPFNGVDVGYVASPSFVDIDNDGDMDAFVGTGYGPVLYYKNTGTSSAPVFTQQTGGANPLNSTFFYYGCSPFFADIDNDGDQDVFIGLYDGTILYYENTGSASAPVFTQRINGANPFNGVNVGYYAIPVFVDIDGDGDLDAFVGEDAGTILYYKNTGTISAPVFTLQAGANNPLNTFDVGTYSAPGFADIDGDGDMDVFIGANNGTISYYKNTGTALSAVFTQQTGSANPFDGEVNGKYDIPGFVDIDNDGDMDVFIGTYDGTLVYYKNTTPLLPLHLLNFSGASRSGYNQLHWQTADEVNTKLFEIERSTDGRNFVTIATVDSKGSNNNSYSVQDNVVYAGKLFYRLKMVDADGRFTYSQVIWLNSAGGSRVSIYPNPAKDWISINIGSLGILKTRAAIFDINGKLLRSILINNEQEQINIKALSKGVYVIKFADGSAKSFIKK